MSLSLSSWNPSLIPLTLIYINKDNRNSSRRTPTTLTDCFCHKFCNFIFGLCISSLIPLNCYPWQLFSPKYHQSNKDKKPSHKVTQIHIHKKIHRIPTSGHQRWRAPYSRSSSQFRRAKTSSPTIHQNTASSEKHIP